MGNELEKLKQENAILKKKIEEHRLNEFTNNFLRRDKTIETVREIAREVFEKT